VLTRIDDTFRREAEHFQLRWSCESCAHFEEETGACSHGFPNSAHRLRDLEGQRELVFCKDFELG
jgi:hypothetical protein